MSLRVQKNRFSKFLAQKRQPLKAVIKVFVCVFNFQHHNLMF